MQISLEEKENPSEGTISHAIGCKYCIGVSSISATIFQKGLLMLMMACFLVILSHQAEKCIIFVHVRQRACKVNQSLEKKGEHLPYVLTLSWEIPWMYAFLNVGSNIILVKEVSYFSFFLPFFLFFFLYYVAVDSVQLHYED